MGLPEQERYSIKALTTHWEKPDSSYVEDKLRTRQFNHIIIVGELIGGSPLTRHLYFDRSLWMEHYGKKLAIDPAIRTQELEESIKHHEKHFEKEGKKLGKTWRFDPSALRKAFDEDIGPTHFVISENEVANLCTLPPQKEWKRPQGVRVYIPRSAVEAFERKYKDSNDASPDESKKKEKDSAPDLAGIVPERRYLTSQTARWLGVSQKHVQNNLLYKLKAEKQGGRYYIQGQAILNYTQKGSR